MARRRSVARGNERQAYREARPRSTMRDRAPINETGRDEKQMRV